MRATSAIFAVGHPTEYISVEVDHTKLPVGLGTETDVRNRAQGASVTLRLTKALASFGTP
jgi:hypothetical protein